MLKRFTASLIVFLLFGFLTFTSWNFLRKNDESKTARIAEAESYAARSQLIRNVESTLDALRDVRDYWSTYGHLPREVWKADTGVDPGRLEGIEALVWNDTGRDIRYLRTPQNPAFDYRPGDEEWSALATVLKNAARVDDEAILGPWRQGDSYRIAVVIAAPDRGGVLIAVIDTQRIFGTLLRNESPGYAITVLWNDAILYQRGQAAAGIPQSWAREGLIRTSTGTLWKVVHTPTPDLVASLTTPAIDAVLPLGLAISVLVASLIFENGRSRMRAAAAERAERQLAHLNRSLEQQIDERTEELANRNSDLETITDSVAHDLRNPLNSISVNTQVLEQQFGRELGDEGLAALDRTASGVRRMTEILNRLVGLSVVSHSTFQRQRIDMSELVTDTFEELRLAEPSPAVEFVFRGIPDADADPTLVRTLVSNLLSNALKYTRGQARRQIEVTSTTAGQIHTYCFRDNGVGFDTAYADRMFDAFQRLPTGRQAEGLGLGLTIAARVVKRHGGLIWAEGAPDRGAAFYFTLRPKSFPQG